MLRWLALAALLATTLPAQQAAVTFYGSGCLAPPMVMDPRIDVVGLPHLGRRFAIDYLGIQGTITPGAQLMPVLLTGSTRNQLLIPQSLFPQQRPGCEVLLKACCMLPMAADPSQPGQFVTRVWFTLPRDASLIGTTWMHQWVVAYVVCNTGGRCQLEAIGASDAAELSAGF